MKQAMLVGDKLTRKNIELTADDYKETTSYILQRKAVVIEAVSNLQNDGEVGKASLII